MSDLRCLHEFSSTTPSVSSRSNGQHNCRVPAAIGNIAGLRRRPPGQDGGIGCVREFGEYLHEPGRTHAGLADEPYAACAVAEAASRGFSEGW